MNGKDTESIEIGMIYEDFEGKWEVIFIETNGVVIKSLDKDRLCIVPEYEVRAFVYHFNPKYQVFDNEMEN